MVSTWFLEQQHSGALILYVTCQIYLERSFRNSATEKTTHMHTNGGLKCTLHKKNNAGISLMRLHEFLTFTALALLSSEHVIEALKPVLILTYYYY